MRKQPYYFVIGASVLFLACTITHIAHAAIIIDAVEPGSPGVDDEYVSIKNTGDTSVDISKWSIQMRSDTAATIQKKNFLPGMRIEPHANFIVANKDGRFALQAQMLYSSLSLSGDGGTVALAATTTYITNFDDPVVAAVAHFGGRTATSSTTSVASNTTTAQTTVATSTAVQSKPDIFSPSLLIQKTWPIFINELLPRPTKGDEFIELYNASSAPSDVSGLWLRDASGATYALGSRHENTLLAPYEFRIWPRAQTAIALNNTDGEIVQLIDGANHVLDEVMYVGDAPPDAAYEKNGSVWLWTTIPTPSAPNFYAALPAPPVARAQIPAGPLSVEQQFSVSAEDTTDPNNDISLITWNFGDGFEVSTTTSTHAFSARGIYTVQLFVQDSLGATSSIERAIRVLEPSTTTPQTTSTTSSVQIFNQPEKIHTASTLIADAKKIRTPTKKPIAQLHEYSGVVSVGFGFLNMHELVVNDRTVQIDPHQKNIAELTRGTAISFTATEQIKHDRPILVIEKTNHLRILGETTPAPLIKISGVVINADTAGFDLNTTTTTYHVVTKTKLVNEKRVAPGDFFEIEGVIVLDSPEFPIIIPLRVQDVTLLNNVTKTDSQKNNYALLGITAVIFVLLHLFLTHYSVHSHGLQIRARITQIKRFVTQRKIWNNISGSN